MKLFFRRLFQPILRRFEAGDENYIYKSSHRSILIIMSLLFSLLASLVFFFNHAGVAGYYFPVLVFGGAGMLGLIIGCLGSNRAVAKIWGSR
ncbi:MAG: hypothetical protein KUG79_01000 [Pseudomonadales bacterium]|nr:hypothetical protein [Pseudomonadales bacterium]